MFVSAVETAANRWSTMEATPIEKLRTSKPDLKKVLFDQGGEEHVKNVAELIVPYMGATKKFIDFLLEFLPSPPVNRPREGYQHSWEGREIKKSLKKIYDYRSETLHGGKKFPAPMCFPPIIPDNIPSEIPIGLSTMAYGGIWKIEDTPILLHTFEYIVRLALISWWTSLVVPE